MEQHPYPLVCATNLPESMDQAVPRRFTFKLRFEPLDSARAMLAFRRLLGAPEPPGSILPDGLTPGDFAVVRRKAELLGEDRPAIWLQWLAEEVAAKGNTRPIGFRPPAPEPRPPIRPVAVGQFTYRGRRMVIQDRACGLQPVPGAGAYRTGDLGQTLSYRSGKFRRTSVNGPQVRN
jgi:hypothetical protein